MKTPVFMPVGTQGTVKAVSPRSLVETGTSIMLCNAYHLYLRPGAEIVARAGGLHRFSGWDGPILTDSGGFQVFSLSDLRTVSDEGVSFRSHLDGSLHTFTPESVVDLQRSLGPDIMMVLDECPALPCDERLLHESVGRTHRMGGTRAGNALLEQNRSMVMSRCNSGLFREVRLQRHAGNQRKGF